MNQILFWCKLTILLMLVHPYQFHLLMICFVKFHQEESVC